MASTGFFVFRSIRMASRVLMRLTPSAPASSQARAMAATSVTLGLSFMKTGFLVTALTALVTSAAASGLDPKAMPPPWTLGQEMLTSSHPTCSSLSSRAQVWAYSSMEKPLTLAITGLWKNSFIRGSSSEMTFSTPGF